MNRLYTLTNTLLICQALGCLAGLCLSVLLVQLVRASWSFSMQRRPGILLSAALAVWNLGGLFNAALIIAGFDYQSSLPKIACAFGYSGSAFLTWAILDVWRLSIQGGWRRRIHAAAQGLAAVLGGAITVWLWMDAIHSNAPLSRAGIRVLAQASFYGLTLVAVGLALAGRPNRTTRRCAALAGFGVIGPIAAVLLIPAFAWIPRGIWAALSVYAEQSVNYIVVSAFILLARLRYTDTLVERALQCFAAMAGGAAIWLSLESLAFRFPSGAFRTAGLAIAAVILAAGLLMAAPAVNRAVRRLTEAIFQQPDFRAELQAFS
jgi:hypothetical protein